MPTSKEQKIIDKINIPKINWKWTLWGTRFLMISGILFWIGFLFMICGCSDNQAPQVVVSDEQEDPPIILPDEPEIIPEDPDTEEPEIITSDPIIAIKTADSLKFYDGLYLWTWNTGKVERAKSKNYSCDNILYKLDDLGYTEESRALVTTPDQISITEGTVYTKSKSITLQDSNIWIIEDISADEAMQAGALPKPYTKIYCNAIEYGNWRQNQYVLENIITLNNDIYGQIPTTRWYHLNGSKDEVRVVTESGLAIYDYDLVNKRCMINGVMAWFSTNFFNGAKQWQKSGDVWYSQNGYSWNGETLVENGLAMADYKKVGNMVISAGTRFENGETVLYWIQCATGEVLRYIPSINQVKKYIDIYIADGTTETGLLFLNTLKPQIIDDYLYFIFEENVYRHNFLTGITSHFVSGDIEEVWEY
jgi:hypothetical protein